MLDKKLTAQEAFQQVMDYVRSNPELAEKSIREMPIRRLYLNTQVLRKKYPKWWENFERKVKQDKDTSTIIKDKEAE